MPWRRRSMPVTFAMCAAAVLLSLVLTGTAWAGGATDAFTRALEKGPWYAAIAALLGGLATALTPCVYPMIGVTVAVFGARQATSRWHAMALSTAYVLGMVALYTPLGVLAGLTGSLFGSALVNRWVIACISAIFVALALSTFGLFEFVLPSRLTNRAATMGGIGHVGAFVLGLVSGVVAAPCTGPVLTGILLWIGRTQNPCLGGLVLFLFSVGLGAPFWLVGTFAVSLPKSGAWMNSVKSLFGIVLLVIAAYFLKNAFPQGIRFVPGAATVPVIAVAMLLAGLLLGAVHFEFNQGTVRAVRKATGVALAVFGSVLLITWLEMPKTQLAWIEKQSSALALARLEKRPILIDFTAEWCAACKELSRVTFADPVVKTELSRFVLLRIDSTNDDDPGVIAVRNQYKVVGLPTVLIIDSEGRERQRFTEFVDAKRFYASVKDVR